MSFSNFTLSLISARVRKSEEEQIRSGIFFRVSCKIRSNPPKRAEVNVQGISGLSGVKDSVSLAGMLWNDSSKAKIRNPPSILDGVKLGGQNHWLVYSYWQSCSSAVSASYSHKSGFDKVGFHFGKILSINILAVSMHSPGCLQESCV
jgi:hypothetical protein